MYLSLRKYRVDHGDINEVMARVQEGFVSALTKEPSFYSYYAVEACGGSAVLSISVFEDREGAEASNRAAEGWVKEHLAELLPDPPEITVGDIRVHEVA